MNDIINNKDFTEILMVAIFIFLCASIALLIILSFFKEKNKKKETPEEILEFIDLSMKEDNKVKQIFSKEEVKEELSRESREKIELDIVLAKMKEDLEKKDKDVVRTFEQEQEEKSIISYQELLKKNQKEEVVETLDIEEEPAMEHYNNDVNEHKKFKNSEFISPIYGRVNNETEYPKIELFGDHDIKENETITKQITAEKIDHEIEKSEKFLKQLKEFRKNLE